MALRMPRLNQQAAIEGHDDELRPEKRCKPARNLGALDLRNFYIGDNLR
jgi:hypothetical protein